MDETAFGIGDEVVLLSGQGAGAWCVVVAITPAPAGKSGAPLIHIRWSQGQREFKRVVKASDIQRV